MTHVTCRLTAKNRDQLRNPTLGNRVRATFTFFTAAIMPKLHVSSFQSSVFSLEGRSSTNVRDDDDAADCVKAASGAAGRANVGRCPASSCVLVLVSGGVLHARVMMTML